MTARSRNRSILTAGLAAFCVALGVLILVQLAASDAAEVIGSVSPAKSKPLAAKPARPPFAIPPLEALTETTRRPLFRSDRRPAPAAPEPIITQENAPEPAALEKSDAVLVGTVVSDAHRRALVRLSGKPELTWVAEGERIDGWQVLVILPDRVTLSLDGEADHLWLDPKRAKSR